MDSVSLFLDIVTFSVKSQEKNNIEASNWRMILGEPQFGLKHFTPRIGDGTVKAQITETSGSFEASISRSLKKKNV